MKNLIRAAVLATAGGALLSACATSTGYQPVVNGQHAKRSGVTRLSLSAGAPLYVGPFSRLNAKCGLVAHAKARITQAPENGTLRIIRRKGEAGFDADSPLAHCDDTKINGPTVHYQPRKDFIGADAFTFEVVFPDGEKRVLPYEVILR